jgi:deoxyribonuclease-4
VLFGAHLSVGGKLADAPARAAAIGAECVQVFVTNPRGWRTVTYPPEQLAAFRDGCAAAGLPTFVHVMYLVNYATGDDELYKRSVTALRHTLRVADELGVVGAVTHLGSHLGAGFRATLPRLVDALAEGLAASELTWLLLENSAGSGNTIGSGVDQLAAIIDGLDRHERVGVCLDPAHALAAGHEIRTKAGLDAFTGSFDAAIGLDRLRLLHLNDSKTDLGSRVDRHQNIGDGHIGLPGFTEIVNHPALRDRPGVLEIPGLAGNGPDAANLDRLRALVR